MKKYLILIYIFLIVIFCGCNNNKNVRINDSIVNGLEAKEKVENGAILIDVRTKSEYIESHIEGAVLLPVDDINEKTILEISDNKNTVLVVYCASGNRSGRAVNILKDLGYTNVYDLGSINNWEE